MRSGRKAETLTPAIARMPRVANDPRTIRFIFLISGKWVSVRGPPRRRGGHRFPFDVMGCSGVAAGQAVRSGPLVQPGVTARGMSAAEVLEERVDTPGASPAVLLWRRSTPGMLQVEWGMVQPEAVCKGGVGRR